MVPQRSGAYSDVPQSGCFWEVLFVSICGLNGNGNLNVGKHAHAILGIVQCLKEATHGVQYGSLL